MSKSRHKKRRRANAAAPDASPEETQAPAEPEASAEPLVAAKYLPLVRSLMLLLLLLGLAWRFVGVRWDGGFHLHPDERFLTMVVPELKLPGSLQAWLRTASSPFNPYVSRPETGLFIYGQLPLFVAKLVATYLPPDSFGVTGTWDSYDGILVLGRLLSALFDAGTVLVTWLIGRRLLGRDAGLLAAILAAFTALHIQLAHFYTVDTFATFFLVLSFWALLKWLGSGRARWAAAAGAALGLSVACKISALLFAPIVLLALLLPLVTRQRVVTRQRGSTAIPMLRVLASALALGAAMAVAFRLGHPMAFRGEAGPLSGFFDLRLAAETTISGATKTFWTSFVEQRGITIGEGDVPWNLQWFGRANILWPLRNLLVWGVGWQAMLPALAALAWLPWRVWRRSESPQWMLVWAWALLGFGYNAAQYSKFSRYFLIVTPFFALLAAWFAARLWLLAQEQRRKYLQHAQDEGAEPHERSKYLRHAPLGAALAVGAILGGTVCWGSAVASIYAVPHTRVVASEFLNAQPPGTAIANESLWDDTLPLTGQEKFQMLNLKLIDHEDEAWRTNLLDSLERADWLVVSSPRMWASLPRLPMRYPLTSLYYKALFGGHLGLLPRREFTSYPQLNLFGWRIEFPDDNSEEALTVYDHPRVVLWQKTPSWSRQSAERSLDLGALAQRDEAPLKDLIARGAHVDEDALPWLPSPNPAAK